MIQSSSNQFLYANFTVIPSAASTWTSMSIKLDETGNWKVGNIAGATATRGQVIDVIGSLVALRIFIDWKSGSMTGITGSLDNVVMNTHPALPPPPSITSFSPIAAPRGSDVIITGSGFGANASNNTVWFGGVKGNIVSASATSITVTIPTAVDYGPITVVNTTTNLSTASRKKFTPINSGGGGGTILKGSFTSDVLYNKTVGYLAPRRHQRRWQTRDAGVVQRADLCI